MLFNLVSRAYLYAPALRQVKISFRSRSVNYEQNRDGNFASKSDTSQTLGKPDVKIQNPEKLNKSTDSKAAEIEGFVSKCFKDSRSETLKQI